MAALFPSFSSLIKRKALDDPRFSLLFLFFFLVAIIQDRDEQTRLEMKHRKEEDDLYRKFAHHREEEDRRIREEFRVRVHGSFTAEQLNRESK